MSMSSWKWTTPRYVDRPSHQVELAGIKEELDSVEFAIKFWGHFGHLFKGDGRSAREIIASKKQEESRLKKRRREILAAYGHLDDEQTADVVPLKEDEARDLRVLSQDLKVAASRLPCPEVPKTPVVLRYWWVVPVVLGLLTLVI